MKSQFYRLYGKRLLDVFLVGIVTLFFSWLIVLIFIIYWITGETPILFRASRIGAGGVPFTMLKFRTLSTNDGLLIQDRKFLLGNLLRLTNLDELPQIWNIVKGEMSFIGPRPLPVEYATLLSEEQKKRHEVLPGITGWAQVNGKNDISWSEKFKLDLYYVNRVSFLLDLKILAKTLILVLSFKKDTSLSEKEFTG
ncbi:MAG: sugar transferase [Cyclobacteriaceae bacterium]|nr:sugar transferase [Cyclobacteriaceae bacterium]